MPPPQRTSMFKKVGLSLSPQRFNLPHPGAMSRLVRNYDGPFIITGHSKNHTDLLMLRNVATG